MKMICGLMDQIELPPGWQYTARMHVEDLIDVYQDL
jgi:hypothetical protein